MAIAKTLETYLERQGIDYIAVPHPRTGSSMETARTLHVPGENLAKAVVFKDAGGYLMVVIPAVCHVDIGRLHQQLGRRLEPLQERELTALFPDCARGAIPALGMAYGIETVWDKALAQEWEVYTEAGDHETALRLSGEQFRALMADVARGTFGYTL